VTFDDACELSERLFAAAQLLYDNGFYNQAVARGYYAFYVLVDFTARRKDWQWPTDYQDRPMSHIPHSHIHQFVRRAFEDQGIITTKALQPANAEQAAVQLKNQRLLADYKSHKEMPGPTAMRLLRNCREIGNVVLVEADKVKGNKPDPWN
jgi:hypothetical protein